jgi:(2S)-methylsuccinyl-CoA dehydrogenase
MGAFGLSVPADYGGYSEGGDGEYLAMVVATEELSRARSASAARSSPAPRS